MTLAPNLLLKINLNPDTTAPKPYILHAKLLPPVKINRKAKKQTQQARGASDILGWGGGSRSNFTSASCRSSLCNLLGVQVQEVHGAPPAKMSSRAAWMSPPVA